MLKFVIEMVLSFFLGVLANLTFDAALRLAMTAETAWWVTMATNVVVGVAVVVTILKHVGRKK